MKPHAVFLINLVQDVNILRPLVVMAARDLGLVAEVLVTRTFAGRDRLGIWQRELAELGETTGVPITVFHDEREAARLLAGSGGIVVAASDTNFEGHREVHDVMRLAPSSFVKITVQHGFECIGFLQSRDQDLAHGREVTFAADIVCGWCESDHLTAMVDSQRPKLHVSGPTFVLQQPARAAKRSESGIVCENLHSVRFRTAGDFGPDFVGTFEAFCAALAHDQREVVLRPHPGGQYVLKNELQLPPNVRLNNHPIYKVDISRYAYGISAPSSILLDMVVASVPTAVWRDGGKVIDVGNYRGLTEISSVEDWVEFSREATAHPERFRERQSRFLEQLKMPLDPVDVYRRFSTLLAETAHNPTTVAAHPAERERVLFVANGVVPTLQLSFLRPLAALVDAGDIAFDILTEVELRDFDESADEGVDARLGKRLALLRPSLFVFCRYSGPHVKVMTSWARRRGIPVIFNIDDDLLNVPRAIGDKKHEFHNQPARLATVRHLLDTSDLVYCSTERLRERLSSLGCSSPLFAGAIYASGEVIAEAVERPVRKVGYMASADHAHNLDMVLPALVAYLRRHPEMTFELFGSIPRPAALDEFGDRVQTAPPIKNYERFLTEFAARQWDIGICPLVPIPFNLMKTNGKWVEYTSAGIAVIASRSTIYDDCCADGCGMLATTEEEWLAALEELSDPAVRHKQVVNAQNKLQREYALPRLREQVEGVFERARAERSRKPKLGTALADADLHADAEKALRQALRLRTGDVKTRKALTRAVIKTGDEHRILRYVQGAIAGDTADFECHRWLARYHANHHDWPSALESARNALAMDPAHASSRLLVVRTLMHLGRLPEALDELDVLAALKTNQVDVLQLKADIFVRLARLDDAINLYSTALRAEPDHPLISHRLSYALLLKGDIAGFHRFHEKRRQISTFIENNKDYPFRDWNGELSIEGKLLVWSEFGLGVGQNILHMTFLRSLASLGLEVVFEVEPRLVALCRRSFPEMTIVANDAELPAGISHHTPIGSLSRWFKPDLASFESLQPYFMPDVRAVAVHRERLQRAAGKGQLLIGISWTSNNPFVGDVKSVPLERLLDAIAMQGITLVNLQYGDHSQSIALAEAKTGERMLDSGVDNSNDLDGLSAVVAAMDLVVCIGHTTAHMAGALGTPNFVMLPAAPFAHWLAQGENCIWYPATKLFRQAPIDDGWDVVLDRVRRALRDFANRYDPQSWLATTLVQGLRPLPAQAGATSRDVGHAVTSFAAQGAYRSARELIGRLLSDHPSRKPQVQRGQLLARLGHWEDARAVFTSLQTDEGRDRGIDKQILSVSLKMHDLEYALPIARHLADEEAAYRLVAANILYRLRRNEEALEELRAVSVEAPQTEGLSTLFGNLLLEANELERAERYLANQAAMRRRIEDYTLLGRSLSAQGRHEEALAVFEKGRSEDDPAANFWRTQERVECGAVRLVPLPPLLGDVPTVAPNDVVIFLAVDNTYFWQHALVLLGSLGRRSPSIKCHVHVINPDPRVRRAVEAIARMLPDLGLSYSYEQANFDGCSQVHIRTYYASIRFVRFAEIFARSPAVYLCLDADCIVRADVAARVSALEIADIGVRMRYHEQPHLTVAAGALMLRPTAAAAKFIARVGTLIRRTLEAREAVWYLDQVVLSRVLRDLGDREVGASQLGMTYIDWFFHDHSVIWTGKGERKSEDRRYMAELLQYRYIQENEEIAALMHQMSEELPKP
ncbi:MAG TPA: tetratricopeptide repeat protein [Polyangiaceae bacterium]|nr:tetratricopeptide repeat protein [Polyangiaceae bacterium]